MVESVRARLNPLARTLNFDLSDGGQQREPKSHLTAIARTRASNQRRASQSSRRGLTRLRPRNSKKRMLRTKCWRQLWSTSALSKELKSHTKSAHTLSPLRRNGPYLQQGVSKLAWGPLIGNTFYLRWIEVLVPAAVALRRVILRRVRNTKCCLQCRSVLANIFCRETHKKLKAFAKQPPRTTKGRPRTFKKLCTKTTSGFVPVPQSFRLTLLHAIRGFSEPAATTGTAFSRHKQRTRVHF